MSVIQSIYAWFQEARQHQEPSLKVKTTQVGVHFEEVREMLVELTPTSNETTVLHHNLNVALKAFSDHLKKNPGAVEVKLENRQDYLDALCDQVVTATGVAHDEQFRFNLALTEVAESNWSKYEDGKAIFNEDGKIMKGNRYFKANLTPFV